MLTASSGLPRPNRPLPVSFRDPDVRPTHLDASLMFAAAANVLRGPLHLPNHADHGPSTMYPERFVSPRSQPQCARHRRRHPACAGSIPHRSVGANLDTGRMAQRERCGRSHLFEQAAPRIFRCATRAHRVNLGFSQAKPPGRRLFRARRLLPGTPLAVTSRVELHLGRLARRRLRGRPHCYSARLPRARRTTGP